MIELYDDRSKSIGVREFPPFVRVALHADERKELFSSAMKMIETVRRKYDTSEDIFHALYGKKKGTILQLLSEYPQSAVTLIEKSGLSPSAVYHFLSFLRKQHIVSKKGRLYSLEEQNSEVLSLNEIIRIEEDPSLRRRYGISTKELELAYFLWNRFLEVAPEEGGYARTYQSEYTLADAVHRWRTGRTDIPVWGLDQLVDLTESDILLREGSVLQYHLPPGIQVRPYYKGLYRLPIRVNSDLDKVFVQLLQKMSKNHLYTFPKGKKWLFVKLHRIFGEFDDSTSRIPSAVAEILKSCYEIKTLERSSACIPPRMRARWAELSPLSQIAEESSLFLHVISLSSRSNGGFEITSRSRTFLQDLSQIASDLGLGPLIVRKKHGRPHFRAYLSKSKAAVLKRYTHLFQVYPDLEIWLRIPLNRIAEKLVLTEGDPESIAVICCEELTNFVESILRSLERKKRGAQSVNYLQHKEKITRTFWEQKLIPSPRRVEELVEMQETEEELYA